MNRKDFVKNTSLAAVSLAVLPTGSLFASAADTKVKIAIVGVGLRGQNHLDLVLRREDVELMAICDIDERMLTTAKEIISKTGKKMPQIFMGDLYAWKKMLSNSGLLALAVAAFVSRSTRWCLSNRM